MLSRSNSFACNLMPRVDPVLPPSLLLLLAQFFVIIQAGAEAGSVMEALNSVSATSLLLIVALSIRLVIRGAITLVCRVPLWRLALLRRKIILVVVIVSSLALGVRAALLTLASALFFLFALNLTAALELCDGVLIDAFAHEVDIIHLLLVGVALASGKAVVLLSFALERGANAVG
jgi:hypothetical protein